MSRLGMWKGSWGWNLAGTELHGNRVTECQRYQWMERWNNGGPGMRAKWTNGFSLCAALILLSQSGFQRREIDRAEEDLGGLIQLSD
jgi:hypothetical protein